jgi:c-di-GMP-binding flagellar brake protein YcgR
MLSQTTERRRSIRVPAVYPVVIRDRRGKVLGRGRTANISESGVFAMVSGRISPRANQVVVELTVPAHGDAQPRRGDCRTVCYRCRVVRLQAMGRLLGIGVEFLEKLA